ncbi:hypothetical protein Salat_0694200 [Sesamum alatum]|uniref:Uncharacterized protein n=1 Tax=Sesamum alatum TaxID=300844 RepID=A0AAE1YSL7_9LAMI|nr:hypothetical protein Salat_0694200 [Sesamum alatum]
MAPRIGASLAFTEILMKFFFKKRRGGLPQPNWQLHDFHSALESANLDDLGFTGEQFTWCNHQEIPNTVLERLETEPTAIILGLLSSLMHNSVTFPPSILTTHSYSLKPPQPQPARAHHANRLDLKLLGFSGQCERIISKSWSVVGMHSPQKNTGNEFCSLSLQIPIATSWLP